ncbi:MAG: hypothetical protein QM723_29495 [Myxococcaceae bacterium]
MLTLLTAAVLATTPSLDDEQELRGHERAQPAGNRSGVVFNLGVLGGESDTRHQKMIGFHGRAGMRFALLDRSEDPGRLNVGLAVLAGADYTNLAHGFGVEGRLELNGGGDAELYQPFFNFFGAAGFQNLWFDSKPELHLGFGAGMDTFFSGVFRQTLGDDLSQLGDGAGAALTTVLAAVLMPTVEVRWVLRPDGTTYKVALFSFGV